MYNEITSSGKDVGNCFTESRFNFKLDVSNEGDILKLLAKDYYRIAFRMPIWGIGVVHSFKLFFPSLFC